MAIRTYDYRTDLANLIVNPAIRGRFRQVAAGPAPRMHSHDIAGEIFIVGWVDYDPKFNFDVQKELEANRDNFIKGVKAKLLTTTKASYGTNPGIEFTAESEQAFFRSWVYVVGRRPYQLIAVSPKGATSSPNVARFHSSFTLLPAR